MYITSVKDYPGNVIKNIRENIILPSELWRNSDKKEKKRRKISAKEDLAYSIRLLLKYVYIYIYDKLSYLCGRSHSLILYTYMNLSLCSLVEHTDKYDIDNDITTLW